jgi:hypothetical protein
MTDTVTFTIEGDEGVDELTVPNGLLDLLREGEEDASEIIGDVAMFGLAQRIHAAVHHSEGETGEELERIETETLDEFEARFGMTYGEATGHDH